MSIRLSAIERLIKEQNEIDRNGIADYATSKRTNEDIGLEARLRKSRIDARNELYNLLTEEE